MTKTFVQQFDISFTGDDGRLLDFGYSSTAALFLFSFL
jgi:hypothetical protein